MYCKDCGQRIADDSRFCKHCGAGQATSAQTQKNESVSASVGAPDSWSRGSIAAVIALVLVLLIASLGDCSGSTPLNTSTTENLSTNAVTAAAQPAATPTQDKWSYTTDVDKVRGGTTYYATTTSTNSIRQDFPYESATTMDLTLRKSLAYGTDVILTISSGQMMCSSYDGCGGTARFDDGPAQRIQFNGPADNSSEVMFVVDSKSFISKLKKADKVVIEKTLYQAGAPQFEFNVRGLKWNH